MRELSLSDVRPPTVRMREVKMPDIKLPEFKFREVKLSDVKMPDVKVPEVKMPDVQKAAAKVTEVKLPDVKLPDVKLSDVKLSDIRLSDALSALSLPELKLRDLPDRSDIMARLPQREASSPVPFILVGAMTGILLGLWLATLGPTSDWIRTTADDLRTRFDAWRAGTADAMGQRMDEYVAPTPVMDPDYTIGRSPMDQSSIDGNPTGEASASESPESQQSGSTV